MSDFGVILFHTTAAVMRAEKLLLKEGFTIKLIPPPRQYSSDCGISIRFTLTIKDQIEGLLKQANIEINSIHQLES